MLCAARASGRAPPSLRRAQRKARSSTVVASLKGGPFCAPIGGPVCTPIDSYDDADPRYQRLNAICNAFLGPLLADEQACRDGRTLAAGVLDSVDRVIDAVSAKPAIFNLNDEADRAEYDRLRWEILADPQANRPASIAA
ncbi:hypothetical protein [Sphingobium naphthae]|uniref:hypothetical protein n=1 Tax=Sphingobium naphthae TaxID=1886786 RepID=UPI00374946DE